MSIYASAIIAGLCYSLMAAGIFISMKIFRIPDITTDGSFTLGAAVTAIILPDGTSAFAAMPVVIMAGAVAGGITGFIHTRLKIDALLSGILVMTALYSINLTLMQRSNIPLLDVRSVFSIMTDEATNQWTMSILFTLFFIGITGYMLKTDFGIAMRATGDSESMSKAMGVNTRRMKIIGLAIANALTALSGFLVCQYQGFTDINMGIGIVISGLGSVLIADALSVWLKITNTWLQLLLVVAGSILFQLVLAAALSAGVNPNLLKLVTACFVLIIVGLPNINLRRPRI